MQDGSLEQGLQGKRRVASHAADSDYVSFARAMLWKLGYAVLPPADLPDPELRIVREDQLGELKGLPPRPLILLTSRREAGSGDARVFGTVRRPAGVASLYRLLQAALEEHPRAVPRVPVALPARAAGGPQEFELVVRSISENGCLLAGPKLPPLESALELAIEFPWGEKLRLEAVVSYEQAGQVGALFQGMTLAGRLQLGKQVQRLLAL
jgi:PilZ domain